jgi:hypothetical protein
MTLRLGGAIAGGLSVAAGIAVFVFARVARPFAIELVLFGGLLVAGSTFERWKYRPRVARDLSGWAPTDEVFYDPISGERKTVMYNAATGERDYRATS